MKRRDFIERGSLALGAIAASDMWLGAVVQGGTPKMPDIFGTYFGVGKEEMTKLLGICLSRGADFADLFFEHRVSSSLAFEDNIVRNAGRGIVQGVGVRVVKDDQVGFAFSEDLSMESMSAAARTAAAIANDKAARFSCAGGANVGGRTKCKRRSQESPAGKLQGHLRLHCGTSIAGWAALSSPTLAASNGGKVKR